MQLNIDTASQRLEIDGKPIDLYSDAAFEALSDLWVKVGWNQKYPYTFPGSGRP